MEGKEQQSGFSNWERSPVRKQTRKEKFLYGMEAVLPFSAPVFGPGNRFTELWDPGQDGFSGGNPCKGASLAIVVFNKTVDLTDQCLDVGEGATSNGLLGNQSRPAVHLVDPGCLSRGVIHLKPRPDSKPFLYLGMFMATLVVRNKVDIKKISHVCFNMF